jgi:hypothetical protein
MIPAFALLLASASPAAGDVNRAIWGDFQVSAAFGGGRLDRAWTHGRDPDHPPILRIARRSCHTLWGVARCRFDLSRELDPHSRAPDLVPQPARLRCTARLRRTREGDGEPLWQVIRTPPFDGLSLTSMRCRPARPGAG